MTLEVGKVYTWNPTLLSGPSPDGKGATEYLTYTIATDFWPWSEQTRYVLKEPCSIKVRLLPPPNKETPFLFVEFMDGKDASAYRFNRNPKPRLDGKILVLEEDYHTGTKRFSREGKNGIGYAYGTLDIGDASYWKKKDSYVDKYFTQAAKQGYIKRGTSMQVGFIVAKPEDLS